ncbi:type II secretion system F family protein [Stieleria sp. JC731]|uniref:type II secretion system F family protein n=1 Tax=Pirellulaceae TaxID=2691357 RepID=UPI001E4953EE|nr:type II secretion system F family protein [Stieleria sp. JC731]MCC9603918.1 type II secretion system F family protein [Stieleria sp. JC731]
MSSTAAGPLCRRLGVGVRAGVSLLRLLDAETKYGSPRQKAALTAVLEDVKAGFELHEAFQNQAPYFPRLMVTMTRAGESTGTLERTFLTLANHYDHQLKIRRQFFSSIAWPMLQLGMSLCVISLVIYLLGILQPAGGGAMNDILGFGLRGGSGVIKFWLYVACVAALIWAAIYGFRQNLGGIQNMIPVFYLVPKFGPAIQTITLSRFTRILSIGLSAGLDPIRSVQLALASTDSDYYRSGNDTVKIAIEEQGETLAGALRATELFPDTLLHLIEVSELSGTESESIEHIAEEYEERAKSAMRTISGIATGVIWLAVVSLLVFMILRIAMTYIGGINSALEDLR